MILNRVLHGYSYNSNQNITFIRQYDIHVRTVCIQRVMGHLSKSTPITL